MVASPAVKTTKRDTPLMVAPEL
ncbi:hypothetical protein AGR6A_Cc60049 [Agrobacterium sp. NCPPB 925]|nr:hypothetical protein AGR6A_Cc60049 [Agrobacterium sp. NCPPB 925]